MDKQEKQLKRIADSLEELVKLEKDKRRATKSIAKEASESIGKQTKESAGLAATELETMENVR
ncbi:hypothetical protein [Natribacillus halophilus]|uniref:Uncharacterized protein n=1 Tax=Natribacillus halophilus TaxID=549003 RepID=A0A1G8RUI2_9BACI|nr:hypothetical protein [Natribacillus halophilus]SDJ19990.1 hypothetical protein SAMN04488123_12026 [Natribacillus halophilus]